MGENQEKTYVATGDKTTDQIRKELADKKSFFELEGALDEETTKEFGDALRKTNEIDFILGVNNGESLTKKQKEQLIGKDALRTMMKQRP